MKNLLLILFVAFNSLTLLAQTPQNINPDSGKGNSMWDSTTTIIFIAAFILLLIISRTWSKSINKKRDELSKRDKEEKEEGKEKKDK